MNLGITDKIALLSGADSGIGKASALELAANGVKLILTDLKEDGLKQAAKDIKGDCKIFAADLTDQSQVDALKAFCESSYGMPDILVNCAGITGEKGDPLKLKDEDWLDCWQTDFMSVVRMCRAFVPTMENKGWGRVVAITSENASQPYWEEAVYNTAKAATLNFIKGLSRKSAHCGVLVNTVAPAFIETPMTDGMMEKRAKEKGVSKEEAIQSFLEEERPYLELKRRGKADEVAAVIAFLCSDRASFVNGSNYRVDGGAVATMDG